MSGDIELAWCPGCAEFVDRSEIEPTGMHRTCETTVIVGGPQEIFREMSLEAIPPRLISSPAVGAGHARRYKIADAMWPSVERLLREIESRRETR